MEFEYVKLKSLNEIRGYIEYFPKTLSKNEIEDITNWIVKTVKKNISAKTSPERTKNEKKRTKQSQIIYRNERFFLIFTDGTKREVTVTIASGIIGFFLGIIISLITFSFFPFIFVPIFCLVIGYLVDLAIEEERKKKK